MKDNGATESDVIFPAPGKDPLYEAEEYAQEDEGRNNQQEWGGEVGIYLQEDKKSSREAEKKYRESS